MLLVSFMCRIPSVDYHTHTHTLHSHIMSTPNLVFVSRDALVAKRQNVLDTAREIRDTEMVKQKKMVRDGTHWFAALVLERMSNWLQTGEEILINVSDAEERHTHNGVDAYIVHEIVAMTRELGYTVCLYHQTNRDRVNHLNYAMLVRTDIKEGASPLWSCNTGTVYLRVSME